MKKGTVSYTKGIKMLVDTVGRNTNPVIVMINGSFTTGKPFLKFADEYLSDEFYVVCPTYDGHHEGNTVFDSRQGQARKIFSWLKENFISEILLIQGLSMGAEVTLELAKQIVDDGTINVHHYFLDGGPFFDFPKLFRKFMYFKFKKIINMGKDGNTEKLMNNRMVKWMVHGDIEPYRDMMGDMPVDVITDMTIQNETEACYTFDFPRFARDEQEKMTFSWSSDEPANKSAKKIKECYPYAAYQSAGAMGHGGFIMRAPEKYAEVIKNLATR